MRECARWREKAKIITQIKSLAIRSTFINHFFRLCFLPFDFNVSIEIIPAPGFVLIAFICHPYDVE